MERETGLEPATLSLGILGVFREIRFKDKLLVTPLVDREARRSAPLCAAER